MILDKNYFAAKDGMKMSALKEAIELETNRKREEDSLYEHLYTNQEEIYFSLVLAPISLASDNHDGING